MPHDPLTDGLECVAPARLIRRDPARAFDAAQLRYVGLCALRILWDRWGLKVTFTPAGKLTLGPPPVPDAAVKFAKDNKVAIRRRFQWRAGK